MAPRLLAFLLAPLLVVGLSGLASGESPFEGAPSPADEAPVVQTSAIDSREHAITLPPRPGDPAEATRPPDGPAPFPRSPATAPAPVPPPGVATPPEPVPANQGAPAGSAPVEVPVEDLPRPGGLPGAEEVGPAANAATDRVARLAPGLVDRLKIMPGWQLDTKRSLVREGQRPGFQLLSEWNIPKGHAARGSVMSSGPLHGAISSMHGAGQGEQVSGPSGPSSGPQPDPPGQGAGTDGTKPLASPVLMTVYATMFFAAWGLYSLCHPKDLLRNRVRGRIYEAIRTMPGISLGQLAEAVGVKHQTVRYHLNVLKKAGYVVDYERGSRRLHFTNGAHLSEEDRTLLCLAHDEVTMRVLRFVVRTPGVIKTDVGRALALSRTAGAWHVKKLVGMGILLETRDHGHCRLRAAPGKVERIAQILGGSLDAPAPGAAASASRLNDVGPRPPASGDASPT